MHKLGICEEGAIMFGDNDPHLSVFNVYLNLKKLCRGLLLLGGSIINLVFVFLRVYFSGESFNRILLFFPNSLKFWL